MATTVPNSADPISIGNPWDLFNPFSPNFINPLNAIPGFDYLFGTNVNKAAGGSGVNPPTVGGIVAGAGGAAASALGVNIDWTKILVVTVGVVILGVGLVRITEGKTI